MRKQRKNGVEILLWKKEKKTRYKRKIARIRKRGQMIYGGFVSFDDIDNEEINMDEQKITWDEMIHPDMEAIEKRDAFLSDENGKKLHEMIDQIHFMEDILSDD